MQILKRVGWTLLFLASVIIMLAVVASGLGKLAPALPRMSLFWLALAVALALAVGLPAALFSKKLGFARRSSFALAACVAGAVLGLGWAVVASIQEAPATALAANDERGTPRFWKLDTGSRIAYWRFAASQNASAIPVIFLHGGPGASTRKSMLDSFAPAFNDKGMTAYFYDQAGSGASDRLKNSAEYTIDRMIVDLEEIRTKIGAEKMVIVANSWGAVIAGRYTINHPQRVAALGLLSPVALDGVDYRTVDFSRTNQDSLVLPTAPRLVTALALLQWSPRLAEQFISQEEASRWASSFIGAQVQGGLDCKSAHVAPQLSVGGANLYPYSLLQTDMGRVQSAMAALPGVKVPAIIVRGECDYLPRSVSEAYASALKQSVIHDIKNEGHGLSTKQAEIASTMAAWFATQISRQ